MLKDMSSHSTLRHTRCHTPAACSLRCESVASKENKQQGRNIPVPFRDTCCPSPGPPSPPRSPTPPPSPPPPCSPSRVPIRVPLRLRLRLGYASQRCTFRGTTWLEGANRNKQNAILATRRPLPPLDVTTLSWDHL